MADAAIKRKLGGMPTGENDMRQYEFRVERKTPWSWTVAKLESFGRDTMAYEIAEQMESVIKQAD